MESSALWLFATIYGLIFVAELPDKTAFAALVMGARLLALPVFLGACAAFLVHTVLAVAFGSLLGLLPSGWIHAGAGVLFLVFAVMMWRRQDEHGSLAERPSSTFWKALALSFGMIFVAEWGDLTQLAIATVAARYHAPLVVFSASLLALWSVTALAVALGARLKHTLNLEWLQKIAALAFVVAGLWLLIQAWRP